MTVVAVSGATGFVGRHLCDELSARGNAVRPVARALLQSNELAAGLKGVDTFIHLAARAHILKEEAADAAAHFHQVNVGLTQAAAIAAHEAGVRRFIFVSSAGVLGATSPAGGFQEDSEPAPHDPYTASKLQAEQWLDAQMADRIELAIVRPPLIYGPGAPGNLARLLRLALRGWPLPLGGLREPRSMVAIRNIVDLLMTLAGSRDPIRGTMLVADRETTSVAALYRMVAAHAGHHPWLAPVPPGLIKLLLATTGRAADVARLTGPFVLRPSVAQLRFDWMPPYSLQVELKRTVLHELGARRLTQ